MKLGKVIGFAALAGSSYAAFRTKLKLEELKAAYDHVVAFSGEDKSFDTFEGATVAVVFAGMELDLSEAEMIGDTATLKIYGQYCGIDIRVPEDWNVIVDGAQERSTVQNAVTYDPENMEAKLLIIDYDLRYAGIEIKQGCHSYEYCEFSSDMEDEAMARVV